MARPAVGSVLRRATRRGTSFYLRVTWSDAATGGTTRLLVPLGGEWEGWDEARVRQERELIATLIARGEWVPPQQRPSIAPPTRDAAANAETFQVAASRHFDRRKRRMGSDKSHKDLHWRLAHAVKYLGDQPVDEISAGDIDDMVDAMLRERDAITEAAAQGAALVEDYLDERTARVHQRRRRGLSNSSINKIVRPHAKSSPTASAIASWTATSPTIPTRCFERTVRSGVSSSPFRSPRCSTRAPRSSRRAAA